MRIYEALKFQHFIFLFGGRFGIAHHWRLIIGELE